MGFLDPYLRLAPYVFRQRRWLAAIIALTLIAASTSALQPLPMKLLVDYALGDAATPTPVAAEPLTRGEDSRFACVNLVLGLRVNRAQRRAIHT